MSARPPRRSVSPFGSMITDADPRRPVAAAFENVFGPAEGEPPKDLVAESDARFVPTRLQRLIDAPANDAPELDNLCRYLVRFHSLFEEKGLDGLIDEEMKRLFDAKTDVFLIDHRDRAHCEKMGWTDDHRDIVLFAKERDTIVGGYFAAVSEANPGRFSGFITRWTEAVSPDRALHFLDFCAGSKNPTFEHYLLFAHPALARVVSNKGLLRGLFERARSLLGKITSPTWEYDVRAALGLG